MVQKLYLLWIGIKSTMEYNYINGDKILSISIWKVAVDTETSIIGELKQSPISGRDMYVDQNKERG